MVIATGREGEEGEGEKVDLKICLARETEPGPLDIAINLLEIRGR